MTYGISELVEDLKAERAGTTDENVLAACAARGLERVIRDGSWLDPDYRSIDPETGYGDVLLHEEPDHSLAVFAIAWAPGFETPPHDHHTWVAIGTVEGQECNRLWSRGEDGAGLVATRTVRVEAGQTLTLASPDIHTVHNETAEPALSIHVYGMHPDHTSRAQYDAGTGAASRYVSTDESA